MTVAALYVLPDGPYINLPDIDPWDETRDARKYPGPYPIVAHPPCERWGRYWYGGPSAKTRLKKGDDGGCFAAALESLWKFGGVLEHPAATAAYDEFGISRPPRSGGWVDAGMNGGYVCCVDQEFYGHRAQKATWLYAYGMEYRRLPELRWGKGSSIIKFEDSYHSAEERRRRIKTGVCQRLSKRQRKETPIAFRDLLLSIARLCYEPSSPSSVP